MTGSCRKHKWFPPATGNVFGCFFFCLELEQPSVGLSSKQEQSLGATGLYPEQALQVPQIPLSALKRAQILPEPPGVSQGREFGLEELWDFPLPQLQGGQGKG